MSRGLVDLTGRHAVVTGAGGGLGRAIAQVLAGAGAVVSALDIDEPAARATVDLIRDAGGAAAALRCDVSDPSAVARALDAAAVAGVPDVLVNNAAVNLRAASLTLTPEVWQQSLAVNLSGYFFCAQRFASVLVATRTPGAVVNISSIGGSSALGRRNFAYSVTKGGVEQMTRELAVVWAPHRIRVNAVAPCQIATAGLRQLAAQPSADGRLLDTFLSGIPLGRLAEPGDVAAAVAFLASDAASMITGVVLPVDGGNLALNAGGTVGE